MRTGSTPWVTHKNGFTARAALPADLDAVRDHMLKVFDEDFKTGFNPNWHQDVLTLQETYLDHPDCALWVAVDDATGELVACQAAKTWARRHPQHPDWLHERYQALRTCELRRAYTVAEHRRRGAQRELTELMRLWVLAEGTHQVVNLHTNTGVPGAEPFWRSLAYPVWDSRPDPFNSLHFELPLGWPVQGACGPTAS